jgi:dihydropteroate synthase
MGVLNVTPDSFSDGGLYDTFEHAVAHGLALADEGADVIDVGGESSRPGAQPVPAGLELERVVPVIEALAAAPAVAARGVRLSVDTVKPDVAAAAVAAGATLINDISATLADVAADTGAGWVAMHMRGEPRTMQDDPRYDDVVTEVRAFLLERAAEARRAGVAEVWIDPGIGFGKSIEHNLSLLAHLGELVDDAASAGCAGVAVGTSRKRFLGLLAAACGSPAGPPPESLAPAPTEDRLAGSLATAAGALVAGAGLVRVHDVAATVQLARLYGPAA